MVAHVAQQAHVPNPVFQGVQKTAARIYDVFNTPENLQYIHKIITYSAQLFAAIAGVPLAGFAKLASMVATTDILINGTQLLCFLPTFFSKVKPQQAPPKLGIEDGEVRITGQRKHDEKVGHTPIAYQLKHKPQKAIATVGFFIAYTTCAISMLETIKVPVLKGIEKGFGLIPIFGKELGRGIAKHIFSFGGYALIAAHTALVFDSLRYIYLASNDSTKDLGKGFITLAARLASLSLDFFLCINVANPYMLAVAGLSAGALGVYSIVYRENRKETKALEQTQLLARAKEEARVRNEEVEIEAEEVA